MSAFDTVFALSSGGLPSGVAVLRISGPKVRFVLETFEIDDIQDRAASLKVMRDPADNTVLDRALVLLFQGPRSFTGEDCLEIHCHGGKAVVARFLHILGGLDGLRLAEAGEFTRRAFYNGKMDLIGAEGLSDLINAETESQRRLAEWQVSGGVSDHLGRWRRSLIEMRALIEADLDFADEEDIPGSVVDGVWPKLAMLHKEMQKALDDFAVAEKVREGVRVVLVGAPNAGKSSLLNALAQRDVAIVTDKPGTTRDVLEVGLDLNGVSVVLSDTAGIRESEDVIERIGVERAKKQIDDADIVLFLEDMSAPADVSGVDIEAYNAGEWYRVGTKLDLVSSEKIDSIRYRYDFLISTKSDAGLGEFIESISKQCREMVSRESLLVVQERHRSLLTNALSALRRIDPERMPIELVSEELRNASDEIGRIIGRVDVEDLLDVVFRDFCVGK